MYKAIKFELKILTENHDKTEEIRDFINKLIAAHGDFLHYKIKTVEMHENIDADLNNPAEA